jgi:hypothetical protein
VRPNRHLDFILHSSRIKVRDFSVPQVPYSDHLPLVLDFDVDVRRDLRRKSRPHRAAPVPRAAVSVSP